MFVSVAMILFAIGGFQLLQYCSTMKNQIKVEGVLAELRKVYSTRSTSYGDVEDCTVYPVFEYTVNGTVYTEEYRYEAVNGSELASIANNPDMPDGAFKSFMKKFAQSEPEYIIGHRYTLIVNKSTPKLFFIDSQRVFIKEMKWFAMGGLVLIIGAVYSIVSCILE